MASIRTRPGPRRRRRWLAALGAFTALAWLGSALAVAHVLTSPHRVGAGAPPAVEWAHVSELELEASDGARVPAFAFRVEGARGTAVLLHPNDGCRASMTSAARLWAGLGFTSVAVTLRAHGTAEGERNDVGWTARLDVLAAADWAVRQGPGPVYVHGVSLGAAAACLAAPEYPRSVRVRLEGTVLESPYVDLRAAVRSRTEWLLPPLLDHAAALGLSVVAPVFIGDVDRIAPLAASTHLPGRTLILSGLNDPLSPAPLTRRFVDALGDQATLVERGAGHIAWHAAGYDGVFGDDVRDWVLSAR